jgi:hypothetical protein
MKNGKENNERKRYEARRKRIKMKMKKSVGNLDPDQYESGSLLFRSGFLKELRQFAVRFSASESKLKSEFGKIRRI